MDRLAKLTELRAAALAEITTLKEARKALLDGVEAEAREDLTEAEDAEFRTNVEAVKAKQADVDDLSAQIADLEAEEERAGKNEEMVKRALKPRVEVSESVTYERGNGASYFQDFMKRQLNMADDTVLERLRRHAVDVATGKEYRALDRVDTSGGYHVPPAWLMSRHIELARAGRAYANLAPSEMLPGGTDSINIPKISTGTSTAVQAADNTASSDTTNGSHETDLTDTFVTAPVRTVWGQQGLSVQLLDQSPLNFDEIVFRDLIADYATKVDLQVIGGSGSSGQVKGVRSNANIHTITATEGGTALAKAKVVYAKIADAIQRIHTSRFLPPEVVVMHPRRWAALTAVLATDDRPLLVPSGPGQNQIGEFGGVVSQQVVGHIHGLPVVTDPNLPTTQDTDQDVIHVLRASDLLLFEGPLKTRVLEETRADNLTVLLQVYGYVAFTSERQSKGIAEISGTALSVPTF